MKIRELGKFVKVAFPTFHKELMSKNKELYPLHWLISALSTRWQQRWIEKWTESWSGLWPYSCVQISFIGLPATHCGSCDVDRRPVFGIVCDYLPSVLWLSVSNKQCVYLSFGFCWAKSESYLHVFFDHGSEVVFACIGKLCVAFLYFVTFYNQGESFVPKRSLLHPLSTLYAAI